MHIPGSELAGRLAEIPRTAPIVVYCWGPGCNGSTKAALVLAEAGIAAKKMIGGFEYWAREGLAIETAAGRTRRPVDDLTAPLPVAFEGVD
jgi:rhodanese-related sulfurtransferase